MKIQVTHCEAYGKQFENLKDDSIHEVVPTPKEHRKSKVKGVWVMGLSEPVKLLPNEYIIIDK